MNIDTNYKCISNLTCTRAGFISYIILLNDVKKKKKVQKDLIP
jgi:hypothetical protein